MPADSATFYLHDNEKLVLTVVNIFNDLKAAGEADRANQLTARFYMRSELGIIWSGPGKMRFFGFNVELADDCTVTFRTDDKLDSISEYYFTCLRWNQGDDALDELEKSTYASTSSSLG